MLATLFGILPAIWFEGAARFLSRLYALTSENFSSIVAEPSVPINLPSSLAVIFFPAATSTPILFLVALSSLALRFLASRFLIS